MWAKLDDSLYDHPKLFMAAGALNVPKNRVALVFGTYAYGLIYSAKHLTNGFLPKNFNRGFSDKPELVARALVAGGLWKEVKDGYQIHDWDQWNPNAERVKAKKDWDRRRQQLYRDEELIRAIRARDKDRCRYCGITVNWTDRRSRAGATYDHVEPRGPNTLGNIVVACRECNSSKCDRSLAECGLKLLPITD